MSTLHWKRKKIDMIIKSLWLKRFVKLSWNDLSYELHSTSTDLLKTGKIISNSVISVRIYWSQLKKTFFETLNVNEITDKNFFFTNKRETSNNIILIEKNENLNDSKNQQNLRKSTGNIDSEYEESCKRIKQNFGNENFSFEAVSKKDVLDLIKELPGNKATVSNDIPVSVL